MKNSIFHSKYLFILSGILTLVLVYCCFSNLKGGFLFPPIDKIIIRTKDLIINDNVIGLLLKSMMNVLICIVLSFVLSIFISYIRMFNKDSHELISPFVAFLKSAPLSILIVYFFFLFGRNAGPFIMCFMLIFPLIFEGCVTSMNEISEGVILELKITNVSRFKKFVKVILPMMMPYLIMTFLMSFGLGLKVIVMGEYMMYTPNSLGLLIYDAKTNVDIESLLGILFLCVFLTLIVEVSSKVIFKRISEKFF